MKLKKPVCEACEKNKMSNNNQVSDQWKSSNNQILFKNGMRKNIMRVTFSL